MTQPTRDESVLLLLAGHTWAECRDCRSLEKGDIEHALAWAKGHDCENASNPTFAFGVGEVLRTKEELAR